MHKKRTLCVTVSALSWIQGNFSRQPAVPPLSNWALSVNGHAIVAAASVITFAQLAALDAAFVVIRAHDKLIYAMHQALRDFCVSAFQKIKTNKGLRAASEVKGKN